MTVRTGPCLRDTPRGGLELFLVVMAVPLAVLGYVTSDGWLTLEAVAAVAGMGTLQAWRRRSDRMWLPSDLTVYRGHPVLIGWLTAHGLDAKDVTQVRVADRKVVAEVAIRNAAGHWSLAGPDQLLTSTVTRRLKPGLWTRLWTRHLTRDGRA